MSIDYLADASRRVIAAWSRYDAAEAELRRHYLAGTPRAVDREAFESALSRAEQQRDAEIDGIRRDANRANDFARRLDGSLGRHRSGWYSTPFPTP